jgi:hypothetical protein
MLRLSSLLIFSGLGLGLGLGLGCARNSAPTAPPPPPMTPIAAAASDVTPTLAASAEILVVGDIMMHGSVKRGATRASVAGPDGQSTNFNGYGALFSAVKPVISEADLAFGNLEFPVAPDSHRGEASMVFNAPPEVLGALADAGFDVVSFANNHVYDQGVAGFVETIGRLESSPLDYLGAGPDCDAAMNGQMYDLNGIKVAFLAGSRLYNSYNEPGPGRGCSFRITDGTEAIARAQAAKEAGADLVLLSVHWGVEYKTTPHRYDVDIAHKLLEGGVDGIIGHHPHVLQPLEVYETEDGRTTFVMYSLGNFISGQGYQYRHGLHHPNVGNTRDGGLLRFKVVRRDYGDGHSFVGFADLRFDPIWVIRQRDNPQTYPVVDRVEIDRLTSAIAATDDAAVRHTLQEQLRIVTDRRLHAGAVVGESWLLPLDEPTPTPAAE